ncbi:MAG: hypothetical protein KDI55_26495, partial [Anaerolineae bacterium]|nr:hypothetical protein [Anaerolineae bacterium]
EWTVTIVSNAESITAGIMDDGSVEPHYVSLWFRCMSVPAVSSLGAGRGITRADFRPSRTGNPPMPTPIRAGEAMEEEALRLAGVRMLGIRQAM